MKLLIEISEETYDYWKEHKHEYVLAEAIADGKLLSDDCKILTKEAYEDLCMRASKGAEHWIDDADYYICPRCGYIVGSPSMYEGYRCPRCGFQDEKDKEQEHDNT